MAGGSFFAIGERNAHTRETGCYVNLAQGHLTPPQVRAGACTCASRHTPNQFIEPKSGSSSEPKLGWSQFRFVRTTIA